MRNKDVHIIKRKVYFHKSYKWVAILLFVLCLICYSIKCCDDDLVENTINKIDTDQEDSTTTERPVNPVNGMIKIPPSENVRVSPIDSVHIRKIGEGPLGRYVIDDLLNIYLEDTVNVKNYLSNLQDNLTKDTIILNYYAKAYKRVQIKINKERKEPIKKRIKNDTAKVKFVTNEWTYSNKNIRDPEFKNPKNSWFYKNIGVFEAWKKTKGDPEIKVAVLDDGFDLKHPELENKYLEEWNVFDYNNKVSARPKLQFHGTHVAGTIVGEASNNYGISGVAPKCSFIPVQISNETGVITTSSILDGIFYALKNDAKIINLSLGFSLGNKAQALTISEQKNIIKNKFLDEEKLWKEVFQIVADEGAIVIQAAGNDGILADVDPMKRSENTIIVGASDKKNKRTKFSNYGDKVDIYAPGEEIYSSLPDDNMGYLNGTSMSAPIISGCVALYLSRNKDTKTDEIFKLFSDHSENNPVFNINVLIENSL